MMFGLTASPKPHGTLLMGPRVPRQVRHVLTVTSDQTQCVVSLIQLSMTEQDGMFGLTASPKPHGTLLMGPRVPRQVRVYT